MLELRRDRCWVKQHPDGGTAKFLWPEFNQMIEWQDDGHAVLLAQRGNSRDSVVGVPNRVHKTGDASVCGANHRTACFHTAKNGVCQVLVRTGRMQKPSVVCYVYQ